MTLVYLSDITKIDEACFKKALSQAPLYRQKKALAFKFFKDQVCSLFSYLLLKQAFFDCGEDISDKEMGYTSSGKPFFEKQKLCFSISHAYPFIAAAVSDDQVGVDVENEKRHVRRIAEKYFSPEENFHIASDTDFLRLWTLKEAMSKATGEGIASGLEKYHFENEFLSDAFSKFGNEFSVYSGKGYVLSLAKRGEKETFSLLFPFWEKDRIVFH